MRSFFDLYHHVVVSIIRGEPLTVHGVNGELPLQILVDMLMAFSSLLFVGLVVTVIFRKTTRG